MTDAEVSLCLAGVVFVMFLGVFLMKMMEMIRDASNDIHAKNAYRDGYLDGASYIMEEVYQDTDGKLAIRFLNKENRPVWGFDSPERLVCSAVWFPNWKGQRDVGVVHKPKNIDRGIVLAGVGHAHCMSQYSSITGNPVYNDPEYQDGFLTSMNRFVGRKEGAKIAYEAGQVPTLKDTIYSECFLWSREKGIV